MPKGGNGDAVVHRGGSSPDAPRPVVSYRLPALLVLAAVPFLRPNLLGEQLAVVGLGLVVAAVVLAVVRRQDDAADEELATTTPARVLVALLGAAYVWLLVRAAATGSSEGVRTTLQDILLTVGSAAGVMVVCRDRRAARWLATGFVSVVVALCASYAVTGLVWTAFGVGSGQIGVVPVGDLDPQPLYFPFTASYSEQTVFGVALPRFTGLGRESGWMAMYCGAAFFLAGRLGVRRLWVGLLLVVGLVGCVSTAGFGVFVVVWAFDTFVRPRDTGIHLRAYVRQLAGVAVVGLAAWAAVTAPVLGLVAKQSQNEISLDERSRATAEGWQALTTHPWGGTSRTAQGGINLISDIAISGLPFVLLIVAALVVPGLVGRAAGALSVIAVVLLTLLLAQPAAASSWVFCLVVVALAVEAPLVRPSVRPLRYAHTPDTAPSISGRPA